jgi:hypothetical protein
MISEENIALAKSDSDLLITIQKIDDEHGMSVALIGVDDGERKFNINERDFNDLKYVSGNMLKQMTQEICRKTDHEHAAIGISFYCNTFDNHVMIGMKFDAPTTSPTVIVDGEIVNMSDMTRDLKADQHINFTYNDIVDFFRSSTTLH